MNLSFLLCNLNYGVSCRFLSSLNLDGLLLTVYLCIVRNLWHKHKQVGPKKAREMWFLARFYTAYEADKMGLVNVVVPVSAFHRLHCNFTCP